MKLLLRGPSIRLSRAAWMCAHLSLLWVVFQPLAGFAQGKPNPIAVAGPAALRSGEHDFDFGEGAWHTHIKRILDPFNAASRTIELDGTVSSRRVWGGRAWLEEIQAEGPNGPWQGLSLFLYNPQAHQWSQTFLNRKIGALSPSVGAFNDDRIELYSQDTFKDRAILVRAIWSDISADAHRYEESFSDDGGKTWRLSFTARKTRIPANAVHPMPQTPNDFDFDIGTWKLHTARLLRPLTGSTQWTEADGRVVVTRIWDGSANLSEIHTNYATGPVDFLALRWYNPVARQWFMDFATAASGQLGVPMAGEFKNGRIDFLDQEPIDGKMILVRFSMWPTPEHAPASEQAFSADGGRTWEVNFRTKYTPVTSD